MKSAETVYKDDKGHTADAMKYDTDSEGLCSTTCSVKLPKDAKAYCYANEDTEDADADQFCGYEKDGFVYGARGCCDSPCPGEECPTAAHRKPEKTPSPSTKIAHKKKDKEKNALPRLLIFLLIVLVILIITACIFLSVDA